MKAPYVLLQTPNDRDKLKAALSAAGLTTAHDNDSYTYPRVWFYHSGNHGASPSGFRSFEQMQSHLKACGVLNNYTPVNSIPQFISCMRAIRAASLNA